MGSADSDILFRTPEWLIIILLLGAMTAVCEAGYRLGRLSRAEEKTRALVPIIAGSILAVVGLLLGFTIAMSVSRYDARRLLVLQEANAIETAYLRTQVVPAPESGELQELLRRYAAARLRASQAAANPQRLQQIREESARLQNELWARAAQLGHKAPQSLPAGLLLESLNNAFDLENARWITFLGRVPSSVIYVNAFMVLVAALLVGYDFGMTGHRHVLSEMLLIVSIALVMAVIMDLDRPQSGIVRVSQQPLVELERRLAAPR